MTLDLQQLRQQVRTRRRALPAAERQQAALTVAHRLDSWPVLTRALQIAAYWACDGELDPKPILQWAWAMDKQVLLPVLTGESAHPLQFAPYRPSAPLRRNRFGIPEPEVASTEWVQPVDLDLVLVPLVAFDMTGTRLGMGGGFYDRGFAFLHSAHDPNQRPYLLGLGYEFQNCIGLIRQPWDIPLDAAVTEQGLYEFSSATGLP